MTTATHEFTTEHWKSLDLLLSDFADEEAQLLEVTEHGDEYDRTWHTIEGGKFTIRLNMTFDERPQRCQLVHSRTATRELGGFSYDVAYEFHVRELKTFPRQDGTFRVVGIIDGEAVAE